MHRLVRLALLALVTLATTAQPVQAYRAERIREALWLGMDYMIRSASKPEHFEDYASDYLFFFADVVRFPDPWIRERALTVGRRLGQIYLERYFTLDSADDLVDAASALYALECLDMDVDVPLAQVEAAAGRFSESEYLGFDPDRGDLPDVDLLIDLLIGFHFTDRLEVPIGIRFAEMLHYVPSVDYTVSDPDESNRYIDVNNLVTHLVYTVSGYASWNVSPRLLPRELDFIRAWMPYALEWADPETLAEYVDSLRILGFGPDDPDVAAGVDLLLALQKIDGRWEPERAEDEYDRYHATWCAMDALRDYALGSDGTPDQRSAELLRTWAEQYRHGQPFSDSLELGPDRRD
ncbi:MAG: hypothetical protein JXR96_23595 [Deltaproteobacteria bacterium]|nr:hypothetical protein [Deltaproteobacteria bacterium]